MARKIGAKEALLHYSGQMCCHVREKWANFTLFIGAGAPRSLPSVSWFAETGEPPQAIAGLLISDLEKFSDRVNHDKLMGQVAKRVEDKRRLHIRVHSGLDHS
jgi:hypothetical protein